MAKLPVSAAYFSRTPEVDEFLAEFIRVRGWYLREGSAVLEAHDAPASSNSVLPYRRLPPKEAVDHTSSGDTDGDDSTPDDDLYMVAKEMARGSALHLDAFICLVSSYGKLVDALDSRALGAIKPKSFELYEIMKHATIKDRKASTPPEGDDLKSALRAAEEKRYQRMVADVRYQLQDRAAQIAKYKPPIIGGLNAIFGVALTFVGGFSVAGACGVKDMLKKAVVGIIASFVALLVDTLLLVIRCER